MTSITEFPDFLAVPLTSNISERKHALIITNDVREKGELKKVSVARVDKISSIQQNLVIFKIGSLRKETFRKLKNILLGVID